MKGTMSELELSLFRQRSQEALRQKARRGALFLRVAAGYVKVSRDQIEKDPDQRVQGALKLLFAKFAEFHSARQVHIWLRDEGIELPVKAHNPEADGVVWRLPPRTCAGLPSSWRDRRPWSPCALRERRVVSKLRGGRQYQSVTADAPAGASGKNGRTDIRCGAQAILLPDFYNKICHVRTRAVHNNPRPASAVGIL